MHPDKSIIEAVTWLSTFVVSTSLCTVNLPTCDGVGSGLVLGCSETCTMPSFFTLAIRILALCASGAEACSPGYYGASCDMCQIGCYCDGGLVPLACSSGYCCGTEGIAAGYEINYKAPAGTYCNSVLDALPATPCPADFYCPEGTQIPIPCLGAAVGSPTCGCTSTSCGSGLQCSSGSGCVSCDAGFFCSANAVPAQCPSGRCVAQAGVVVRAESTDL